MTLLGSIHGVGRVIVDGKDIGEARYEISVFKPNHLMNARGTLEAEGSVLWGAYQAKENPTLVLETGESISFLVSSARPFDRTARIAVNGAVPGFE